VSGCRIGKIKLKGGAILHRLPVLEKDEAHAGIMRAARMVSEYTPILHGYVVFGWDQDGMSSLGYRIDKDSYIGRTLLPAFVADALRRRMIEDHEWES